MTDSSINASDYLWLWNDPSNPGATSTTGQNPTYTYGDTGTYTIQLVINVGWPCADTAEVIYDLYNPINAGYTLQWTCMF